MARRKLAKLKALLYEREMTYPDVAALMGHGLTYVCRRMNGHEPWTFEDAAKLSRVLDIPSAEWADYFMEPRT